MATVYIDNSFYQRRVADGAIRPRRYSAIAAFVRAVRRRHVGPLEYLRLRPTFFVGAQRSGNTVLRETLNTSPEIELLGELLTAGSHQESFPLYAAARNLGRPPNYAEAEAQLWDYLRHVRALRPTPARIYGFDIKYSQLRALSPGYEPLSAVPALVQFFHASQANIVHVVRENVLQAALSEVIATHRDLWHHRRDEALDGRVRVDCELLLVLMRQRHLDREIFEGMMKGYGRMITVDYADTVRGIAKADGEGRLVGPGNPVLAVAEFLGVEPRLQRASAMSKIIQAPYRDVVTNYDEVVRKVSRSEFAAWLETI